MVKKFTIPFASQGDANDIPDALQVDGKVSFTQGFGYDYERPYDDPQSKDIAREDMNGLFKAITSAVGELQTLGVSEWSNAIAYPKGAIVYYEKDLYISQVDDNQNKPPQSWTSIKNIADDSLKKAANLSDLTNKATARNNLGLGSSATLNKTDILGTSTNLVATQKLVNDTRINLNNDINNKIDKTSITNELGDSTELVASQKLVNDVQGDLNTEISKKITGGTVVQGTGSSTTNVMSQKAVTDQLNAIKSGHGLGYGQKWVDVTSQRMADTTYTNDEGKAIIVRVLSRLAETSPKLSLYIDNEELSAGTVGGSSVSKSIYLSEVVPSGSTYRIESTTGIQKWAELR